MSNNKVYELPEKAKIRSNKSFDYNSDLSKSIANDLKKINTEYARSFEAAKTSRLLADWATSGAHINDEIRSAIKIARVRARELYQNNAHIQNYFQLLETNVIGNTGFKLKVNTKSLKTNEAVEKLFEKFTRKGILEVSNKQSLTSLLQLAITTVARDGEAIIIKRRIKPSHKNQFGFALQVISIDRLDTNYNTAQDLSGNSIVMGVELDKFDNPIAYHFNINENKQAYSRDTVKRERIDASDVYHIYSVEFPEQIRGITWLHSVMKPLHQLQAFEDYTLVAARIGASKTGFFIKADNEAGGAEQLADGEDEDGNLMMTAEPGLFQALPPGWSFQEFKPDFPAAAFEQFVTSIQRSIANGLRLCFNTLFCNLTDVNYSSIRQALIAERDMYKSLQAWLIDSLVMPVFVDWLRESYLNNALVYRGHKISDLEIEEIIDNCKFNGRSWGWVDPKNDLEAAKIAKDLGVYSPTRIAEMMGEDIYVQMIETAEVKKEAERLNIFIDNLNDPQAKAEAAALQAQQEAQQKATAEATKTAQENNKSLNDAQMVEMRALQHNINNVSNAVEAIRQMPKVEAKPADINVNPVVNVEAPVVNVNMSSRKSIKTIPIRDEKGLITSVESIVEDLDDEDTTEQQEEIKTEKIIEEVNTVIEEVKTEDIIIEEEIKEVEEVKSLDEKIEDITNILDEIKEDDTQ